MYESPIRLLVQQMETSIREQQDKQIFEAIQKCGVDVDRDELIKALAYDRAQYAQGYSDGRADAQRWISVEERLPENNDLVMVWCDGVFYFGCYFPTVRKWISDGAKITHWMPMPEPPNRSE